MIINAKILKHSDSRFRGVDYHDNKMEKAESYIPADLTAVDYNESKRIAAAEKVTVLSYTNFDPFIEKIAQGIKDFLKLQGMNNSRMKKQQFHAVISCRGREVSMAVLEEAAHLWLKEMGYGQNPYVLYAHADTENNHVHVVTSRSGPNGKKIKDSYEKIRSAAAIKRIGEQLTGKRNIEYPAARDKAFTYQFTTVAQFNMLMESAGFKTVKKDGYFEYARFGHVQGEIPEQAIKTALQSPKILREQNQGRISQLRAILYKYSAIYNPAPFMQTQPMPGERQKPTGTHTSELAEYLKETFGLEMIFHASAGKPPYGYSIIDHRGQAVYKGTEIVGLKELLEPQLSNLSRNADPLIQTPTQITAPDDISPAAKPRASSEPALPNDPAPAGNGQIVEHSPDTLIPGRDILTELLQAFRQGNGQNGEQDRINNLRKKKKR